MTGDEPVYLEGTYSLDMGAWIFTFVLNDGETEYSVDYTDDGFVLTYNGTEYEFIAQE